MDLPMKEEGTVQKLALVWAQELGQIGWAWPLDGKGNWMVS